MTELPFLTADVFTDRPFGGNPLAVFPDAGGLDAAAMQSIAREFNLSETVFVLPAEGAGNRRRLRIFTPAMELPFAGHPTIGAAVILALTGTFGPFASELDLVLEEGVGPVPVHVERSPDGTVRAMLTSPRLSAPEGSLPGRAVLASLLGLPEDALAKEAEPAGFGAGVPFAFVPVRDRTALAAIRIDIAAWREELAHTGAPHLYALSMADWDQGGEIHARMFAPAMGIAEDPATGAAAAALAGYLVDRQQPGDGPHRWAIRQGDDMGRPSRLLLEADIAGGRLSAVRVGGSAVVMSRGVFLVPA